MTSRKLTSALSLFLLLGLLTAGCVAPRSSASVDAVETAPASVSLGVSVGHRHGYLYRHHRARKRCHSRVRHHSYKKYSHKSRHHRGHGRRR